MAINDLQQRLEEAELAYHKLMLGEKEVSVTVGGFGSATYNQTTKKDLESYIAGLKSQIAKAAGVPSRSIIRVSF